MFDLANLERSGEEADELGAGDVERAMAELRRMRGRLDVIEGRLVRRSEALAEQGIGAGGATTLRDHQRLSNRRVDQTTSRAATLAAVPVFEHVLGAGDVSSDHVDALGRAAKSLPDERRSLLFQEADQLADAASSMTADSFERHCRRRARQLDVDEGETRLARQKRRIALRHWTDGSTGMLRVQGEFDPESGAKFVTALEAEVARLAQNEGVGRNERTNAQALLALVSRGFASDAAPGEPELVLIVDAETYLDGLHDDSVCETSSGAMLPPSAARRLSCNGDVVFVAHDAQGSVLSVGRRRRTATRAQRRALRSMYPTCGFAGCDRSFDSCEVHHLRPWNRGGRTDLDNLLPLCSRHHHLVHDQRWSLHLDRERNLTIRRPDGHVHAIVPLPTAPAARRRRDERARHDQLIRERVDALIENRPPAAALATGVGAQ